MVEENKEAKRPQNTRATRKVVRRSERATKKLTKGSRKFIRDFSKFAFKGNFVDLAAGIMIGSAFTATVNVFVKDLIMPPVGLLLGRTDFSNLFIVLADGKVEKGPYATVAAAQAAGATTLNIGSVINALISFFIIALVVFFILKFVAAFNSKKDDTESRHCPYCLTIVDPKATRCPSCTSQLPDPIEA